MIDPTAVQQCRYRGMQCMGCARVQRDYFIVPTHPPGGDHFGPSIEYVCFAGVWRARPACGDAFGITDPDAIDDVC